MAFKPIYKEKYYFPDLDNISKEESHFLKVKTIFKVNSLSQQIIFFKK